MHPGGLSGGACVQSESKSDHLHSSPEDDPEVRERRPRTMYALCCTANCPIWQVWTAVDSRSRAEGVPRWFVVLGRSKMAPRMCGRTVRLWSMYPKLPMTMRTCCTLDISINLCDLNFHVHHLNTSRTRWILLLQIWYCVKLG